jgi:hypothetical protein
MPEDETCTAHSNNLYKYSNRYRGYMGKVMNLHEIDKAIRSVIGVRQFDKRIRKIWDIVLKEKADV